MRSNTISCHQAGVIAGVMTLVLKLTNLPSLLYTGSEIGGVLSIILICSYYIIFLSLIVWLKKKYNDLSLFEIMSKFLTKFGARIIYLILFIFFIFKILALLEMWWMKNLHI